MTARNPFSIHARKRKSSKISKRADKRTNNKNKKEIVDQLKEIKEEK